MVSIGTLEWKVKVDNAGKAKEQAQQVEEKVNDAKDAAEGADEKTRQYSEGMSRMADAKQRAGRVTDKLNAKMGFFGSALSGVISTLAGLIGGLTALKALILGAGIAAAVVAMAIAFKENFGGMREHVMGFVNWIQGALETLKSTALAIWNNFVSGFKEGGGSIADLETIFAGVLDGITQGLQAFWSMFGPIISSVGGVLVELAGVVGKVVGGIVNWLAEMERESQMITKIVGWVTALIATFAAAWAIVQVLAAIASGAIALVSAAGTLLSGLATLISVFGTVISVIGTVVSAVGTIIAALNPVSLAILAIVAVIVAFYVAFKTNFLGIRDITMNVIDAIKGAFNGFMSWLGSVGNTLYNLFVQPFVDIYNKIVGNSLIPDLVNGIKSVITGAVGMIKGAIQAVIDVILAPFKALLNGGQAIAGIVGGAMDAAKNAISGAVGAVSSAVGSVTGAITSGFQGALDTVSGVASSIGDAASDAVGAAQDAAGAAADAAGGAVDTASNAASGAVDTVSSGLSSAGDMVGLDSGGIVKKEGVAKIHKGEAVVPADVTKEVMREGTGQGGGQEIVVNVGGIEVGDQSLDLSKLTRREMKELADMLAERLGDEVRNTTI